MAGGAHNQAERAFGSVMQGHQIERAVGSVLQGHQLDHEPRERKLEKLVKLYLGLVQRPQNAASNVPLSSRIFMFRRKTLDNRGCAELETELELRLNRYLVAKAFAERVGAVWPLDYSGETGLRRATAYSDLGVFVVTEKRPICNVPWTVPRACLQQAAVWCKLWRIAEASCDYVRALVQDCQLNGSS